MLNEPRPYLRFILNSHPNRNGERLVVLRVRVRQAGQKEKKIDLSTGVHVKPEQWLADKQSLSTKVRSASAYNERLRRYHLEILTFCEKALAAGQDPLDELKKLKTQEPDEQIGLIDFTKDFVKSKKDIAAQTKSNYKSLINNLENFIEQKKVKSDLSDINESFLSDFAWFLLDNLKFTNLTVELKLSILRGVLNEAERRGLIQGKSYQNFRIKLKSAPIDVALTENEVGQLMAYKFEKPIYETVKDIFLILCFTGVRYSDYEKITHNNIKIDEVSKQKYVTLLMQKTGKFVTFPLNNFALNILEKYNFKLPHCHPTYFNELIKEVGKLCGITDKQTFSIYKGTTRVEETYFRYELMSSHVGRRTWATLSYKKGLSLESISRCLGHSSITQTENYLRLKETDFSKEISKVWNNSN